MQVIEKVGLLAVAVAAVFTNYLLAVVSLDVPFQVPAIKDDLDNIKYILCQKFGVDRKIPQYLSPLKA